jgi:hypothetical protein
MRHGRQMRLAEVGEVGQKRLAAAQITVAADGLAGEVAVRYLAGAGVGRLSVKTLALSSAAKSVDPAVHVSVDPSLAGLVPSALYPWRRSGPSDVAAGAQLALQLLRSILRDPT